MSGTYVRVRVPSTGTAAGEFIAAHHEARMACIETGRTHGPQGPVVDHFALVEGVKDQMIADLLLAWDRAYGVPATLAAGTSFALRLPLPMHRLQAEVVARMKALDLVAGSAVGHVLEGRNCDLWIACGTTEAAQAMAGAARLQLPAGLGAVVTVGEPAVGDQECWAALRLADEVAQAGA